MTTKTKRTLIDSASILWALLAALVWLNEYDLSKLGLTEIWQEAIKFVAALGVIILQSIKPSKTSEVEQS